jgi:hypothetical protein
MKVTAEKETEMSPKQSMVRHIDLAKMLKMNLKSGM